MHYASLQNLTTAVFYFRKDVKSTYEYLVLSVPMLFAEMGGFIGLLESTLSVPQPDAYRVTLPLAAYIMLTTVFEFLLNGLALHVL